MTQWTDSDNLVSRDALIVGGPYDGLRVAVSERPTMEQQTVRWPDVFDLTNYEFDRETWTFRLKAIGESKNLLVGKNPRTKDGTTALHE